MGYVVPAPKKSPGLLLRTKVERAQQHSAPSNNKEAVRSALPAQLQEVCRSRQYPHHAPASLTAPRPPCVTGVVPRAPRPTPTTCDCGQAGVVVVAARRGTRGRPWWFLPACCCLLLLLLVVLVVVPRTVRRVHARTTPTVASTRTHRQQYHHQLLQLATPLPTPSKRSRAPLGRASTTTTVPHQQHTKNYFLRSELIGRFFQTKITIFQTHDSEVF